MNKPPKRYILLAVISVVVVVSDQITKWLASSRILYRDNVPVIDGFFDFVNVRNTGAAFGLLADAQANFRVPFFIVVSIIAIVVISFMIRKVGDDKVLFVVSLANILGGAIGNFIDRIRFGYVIDFLDFHVADYHWPAFNIADIAIVVGVGLMLVENVLEWRREREEAKAGQKASK